MRIFCPGGFACVVVGVPDDERLATCFWPRLAARSLLKWRWATDFV